MASECSYLSPGVLAEALKDSILSLLLYCCLCLALKNAFIQILDSWWVCFPPFPFACLLELKGKEKSKWPARPGENS